MANCSIKFQQNVLFKQIAVLQQDTVGYRQGSIYWQLFFKVLDIKSKRHSKPENWLAGSIHCVKLKKANITYWTFSGCQGKLLQSQL